MAILVGFKKVREDSQEVEYMFGDPEMDRALVITKAETPEGTPLDGNRDKNFHAVLWKVLRGHQTLGEWPKSGSYAA